ncbi:hypothetical protein diail_2656 [Diaporthe ilicicola]|nr:hypothetical protein diail_2656 [Diaporthe ilicicola]
MAFGALGAIFFVVYALYRAALPKPIPGIPYHKASAARFLGDAPAVINHKQKYATTFDWMAAQVEVLNSPIVQIFLKPFSKPTVVITDPREIQDVTLRRAKDFDRSVFFGDAFGGTPPSLHRHILNLMELWRVKNKAAKGHAFEVAEDINLMALDSIWDVSFGSQLLSVSTEIDFLRGIPKFEVPAAKDQPMRFPKPEYNSAVRSMKVITETLDKTVTSPMPRQTFWLIQLTPSYRRARAHKDRLIRERLEDAKSRLLNRGDQDMGEFTDITCATDHMVRREAQAAAKEDRTPQYDSPMAKDEMFGFLIAGHDTTATTLMWAVKYLADSPRVQEKLLGILHQTFGEGNGVPTAEQITTAHLPYLDAVVEEMARSSGTASAVMRTAVHDTTLLGHQIPKGVDVFMMVNGPGFMGPNNVNESILEHDRSETSQASKDRSIPLWDPSDIKAFKPERWIKTDEKGMDRFDVHAGPVMQFGGGLRGCFGKKLAYLEMRIFVTLLVWTYQLEQLPEKLRGYEAFDSLTHKPKQCNMILKEVERPREK